MYIQSLTIYNKYPSTIFIQIKDFEFEANISYWYCEWLFVNLRGLRQNMQNTYFILLPAFYWNANKNNLYV